MPANGRLGNTAVEQAIANARAQEQAQAQLLAVLQAALQNPHTIKRAATNLTGLGREGEQAVLLVALPSGERWDIPLAPAVARNIGRQLLGIEDPTEN